MAKPERNAQWLKMYEAGMTDSEIAEASGSTKQIVACWRNRNKLPVNAPQKPHEFYSDETKSVWQYLYKKGLDDKQIAEIEGCEMSVICSWRHRSGLPPQKPYKPKRSYSNEQKAGWLSMYKAGMRDAEIAKLAGCQVWNILYWRKKNNLPPNKKRNL